MCKSFLVPSDQDDGPRSGPQKPDMRGLLLGCESWAVPGHPLCSAP